MANRYDKLVSLFRLMSEEVFRKGKAGARDWLATQDPRPANFTLHDIVDVTFENGILNYWLKDGRSWSGPLEQVRPFERNVLLDWAELKAVEEDLGMSLGDRGRDHPGDQWYEVFAYSETADMPQPSMRRFSTREEAETYLWYLLKEGVIPQSEKHLYGVDKVTKGPGPTEYWRVQVG